LAVNREAMGGLEDRDSINERKGTDMYVNATGAMERMVASDPRKKSREAQIERGLIIMEL